jgi:hypothetical protein
VAPIVAATVRVTAYIETDEDIMTDTPTTTPDTSPGKPGAAPMPPTKMPIDATKQAADPKVEAASCCSDDKKAATPVQPKT